MVLDFNTVFNSSLEVGKFIQSSNDNFTGSLFLTLLIIVAILILIAALFKMPETIYLIPIIPIFIVFSTISSGMQMFVGVICLIFAYVLFQLIPVR